MTRATHENVCFGQRLVLTYVKWKFLENLEKQEDVVSFSHGTQNFVDVGGSWALGQAMGLPAPGKPP